jgi:hypothetical protein
MSTECNKIAELVSDSSVIVGNTAFKLLTNALVSSRCERSRLMLVNQGQATEARY